MAYNSGMGMSRKLGAPSKNIEEMVTKIYDCLDVLQ